jgi:hypothetical protein
MIKVNKFSMLAITLSVLIFVFLAGCTSQNNTPGTYDNFAKCLTDKGVIMYGSATCPHCQDQKKMFGDSFKYINYIECSNDPRCTQAGIQYVPTWSINGTLQPAGEKTIQELSSLTGCQVS